MEAVGDFTLIKELGSGITGKVFLGEHRFLKKEFALKLLDKELMEDPFFSKRFEQEVYRISSLDHPSIVKIHNISEVDGNYFLVMDPIVDSSKDTMNLERYLAFKGKSITEMEIEAIARQIASALDYAHQLALDDGYLLHGALKLSNILIKKKENKIRVYLSDFALTQFMDSPFYEEKSTTAFDQALHEGIEQDISEKRLMELRSYLRNIHFLAPEQKALAVIDAKADVYAFGVLLYYLFMRTFPEGCFPFPSSLGYDYTLNWDLLLFHLLQKNAEDRPAYLVKAMDDYLHAKEKPALFGVKQAEEKIDAAKQMSFSFPSDMQKSNFFIPDEEPLKPLIKPGEIKRPQYDPDPAAIFHKETTVSRYQPAKVEIKEVEPILTEMVVISGGSYFRGSRQGARDEMPCHQIKLSSFAMDTHPVTNEQFVRFLLAMGGEKDENNNDIIRLRDSRIKRNAGKLIIESGYAKHPVVGVTWYGATAYAKWVGKRLPTEAEWEISASGGNEQQIYPTGEDIERSKANFFSADTTPVMSYPPNEYGLYDMAGNVYEWCIDWYAYNYYETSAQEPDNPGGPQQGVYRVLRGGCWKSLKEDLRCSHRHRNNPGAVNRTYGFRCATDVASD